jgi:hypothetical protein
MGKSAPQVPGQSMPAGQLVTRPLPLTLTERLAVLGAKAALTLWSADMVTVQLPVPLHPAPLQPAKLKPEPGVAVNAT